MGEVSEGYQELPLRSKEWHWAWGMLIPKISPWGKLTGHFVRKLAQPLRKESEAFRCAQTPQKSNQTQKK